MSPRTVRDLIAGWLDDGWLEVADAVRKTRRYRLSAKYRRCIGTLRVTAE